MRNSMRNVFGKKIYMAVIGLSLVAGLAGCGKKSADESDPYAAIRDEVVSFVNEDLAAISSERDEAVAVYNNYFTSDNKEPEVFLETLNNDAIPKMQSFVDELTAIETTSDEVTELKNLYLQGSQKQLDAMNKVATAITEESTDYLTEADNDITESKSYFTQYESQLKLLAIDCNITINGSFSDDADTEAASEAVEGDVDETAGDTLGDTDTQELPEAEGSIQEVN
jgi:hypothetical protein